jgi:hypothetical protein
VAPIDEKKDQPARAKVWQIRTAVPKRLHGPMRAIASLHGWDTDELLTKAFEALAEKQGMPLPPAANNGNQWAGN